MTPRDWSNGFSAAWDFVNGRDAGLAKLDQSVDGFFRSFAPLGVALVVDAMALGVIGSRPDAETSGTLATYIVARLALAVFAYAVSFVVLFLLLDAAGRRQISVVISAHNWIAPIASLIGLPLALVSAQTAGSEPSALQFMLFLATIALLVMIGIRLMRISLQTTGGHAALLFVATSLTSILVHEVLGGLFGF